MVGLDPFTTQINLVTLAALPDEEVTAQSTFLSAITCLN